MPGLARPHLLPAALDAAMQDKGINQVRLSERTGIAISRLNNYLRGNYRTIKPGHLAAICGALGTTPADTAPIVQAYLYDLLPESCRGLIEICVPGARDSGRWKVPSKGLPPHFAVELRNLYRLCVTDPKVRRRTAEWVELMRETAG